MRAAVENTRVSRICACRLCVGSESRAPSGQAAEVSLLGLVVLFWEGKARHHQAPILALWVGLAGWAPEAAVGIERPISEVLVVCNGGGQRASGETGRG